MCFIILNIFVWYKQITCLYMFLLIRFTCCYMPLHVFFKKNAMILRVRARVCIYIYIVNTIVFFDTLT